MEIKVANEAKQDTIIGQGNQILSKINNRQVFAQCVKSVQRGVITDTINRNSDKIPIKKASISPVNLNKSIFLISNNGSNWVFFLKSDGIYLFGGDSPGHSLGSSEYHWQVIEFY